MLEPNGSAVTTRWVTRTPARFVKLTMSPTAASPADSVRARASAPRSIAGAIESERITIGVTLNAATAIVAARHKKPSKAQI